MELHIQTAALLLLIAAVVAMLTRRLRLPYSVGLVATGIILAFLRFAPAVSLTKDLIFTALLPPLLFEAALYLDWHQLRRDFPVIVLLATVGVLLSAGVTAAGQTSLRPQEFAGGTKQVSCPGRLIPPRKALSPPRGKPPPPCPHPAVLFRHTALPAAAAPAPVPPPIVPAGAPLHRKGWSR